MSVSCPVPSWCAAVGNFLIAPGRTISAPRAHRARFGIVPGDTGDSPIGPNAISCPSVGSCIDVGIEASPDGYSPVSELWTGGEWEPTDASLPGATLTGSLNDVWCASINKCLAVGGADTSIGSATALVDRWNGARWYLQPLGRTVSSFPNSGLSSISCLSIKWCMAVGQFALTFRNANRVLALEWSQGRWTFESAPAPRTLGGVSVNAVNCVSIRACVAVGQVGVNGLVESWNGKAWTLLRPFVIGRPLLCDLFCSVELHHCRNTKGLTTSGVVAELVGSRLTDETPQGTPELGDVVRIDHTCMAVGDSGESNGPSPAVGSPPC